LPAGTEACGTFGDFRAQGLDVLTARLRPAHRLALLIACSLQILGLHLQALATRLELLIGGDIEFEVAAAQGFLDTFGIRTEKSWVEHGGES